MTTEKDETFTVLVKGKPLATVKAHLIHAFLSVILSPLLLFEVSLHLETLFTDRIHAFVHRPNPDGRIVAQRHFTDVLSGGI